MSTFLGSWCPQCGSNVSVDEDGCCNSCGCSAVGQGADEAHATIADLRDQNERMRRLLDYVQQTAPGVLVAAHVNAGKP